MSMGIYGQDPDKPATKVKGRKVTVIDGKNDITPDSLKAMAKNLVYTGRKYEARAMVWSGEIIEELEQLLTEYKDAECRAVKSEGEALAKLNVMAEQYVNAVAAIKAVEDLISDWQEREMIERMTDERLAEIELDLNNRRIGNIAGLVPSLLQGLKAEREAIKRIEAQVDKVRFCGSDAIEKIHIEELLAMFDPESGEAK